MEEEFRVMKRNRVNPNKRWKDSETEAIINYIYKYGNLEKPTSREYYNKMAHELKINAPWMQFKGKVRHIRVKFFKTRERIKKFKESNIDDIQSEIEKLLVTCPLYDKLEKIFAKHIKLYEKNRFPFYQASATKTVKHEECAEEDEFDCSNPTASNGMSCTDGIEASLDSATSFELIETVEQPSGTYKNEKDLNSSFEFSQEENIGTDQKQFTSKTKRKISKSPLMSQIPNSEHISLDDKFLDLENKKIQLREDKLLFEKQKHRMDFELELRKQKFEEQQWKERIELQKLDMQQKEQILKYELELKYGVCKDKEINSIFGYD